MNKIVYDASLLNLMTLFETLTGAKLKDCIQDDPLTFVVESGQMGLAIGKGGQNLKRVQNKLNKPIKIIEYNENVLTFIKNMVYPLKRFEITQSEKTITITGQDTKTKALLLGREKANLKKLIATVKRYFDIDTITVA